MTPPTPPRLAARLLRALVPGPVGEAFAGDLEERFARRHRESPLLARLEYWREVLSPSVLRLRTEARGIDTWRAEPTDLSGDAPMQALIQDTRYAVRSLLKSPGFTLVAVLSLALGIGPNTAIYSLVNSLLFQDWGVDDPARIVDVYGMNSDGRHFFNRYENYEAILEGGGDVFEAVTAHSIFVGRFEGDGGVSETVLGEMVTGSYFDVMGVQAALGRTFLPEEDLTPGTHPVVVISDALWRTRYGGDPGIVGGEVRLHGSPLHGRGRDTPGVPGPDRAGRGDRLLGFRYACTRTSCPAR